ncbi:MAG: helix-turn-helix domain-containing protein, partial [Actinocatenispora sp.]
LERIAADRLRRAGPPDRALLWVAGRLRLGESVTVTARETGFSERQLRRRCHAGFGYGAKTLARIYRLQRALAAARAGTSFGTVAADAGFADQAHLARDVKALTGVPLGQLLRP